MFNFRHFIVVLLLCPLIAVAQKEREVTKLQIGVKHKPANCERKSKAGDKVKVHYKGTLGDGTEFDSSWGRGDPLEFTVGRGQVIKGWDQGALGMCVGEKRKLKIPPDMGYGESGAPPKIPGGASLFFDIELMGIGD